MPTNCILWCDTIYNFFLKGFNIHYIHNSLSRFHPPLLSTCEDLLSILLNQFFPGHTEVPKVDTLEWAKVRNNKLDNTFTIKKIKNAFHRMGSFKGAGPDGLKPIVMKNFGPIALRCISFVFKAIYSTGYIPLDLRKSRVVFIPKPLKNYYGEAGSFRPISLTQYYFKTME